MNQYASGWQRFAAALIDGIIIGLINGVFGFIGASAGKEQMISGLFSLLGWAIGIGYWVVYQGKIGQTIGKKAMGIKVVTFDGKTPSMMTFFLREVIGKLISAIILFIGYLMILWDSKKQGLHDKIAGTYVVKVGTATTPLNAPVAQAAPTPPVQSPTPSPKAQVQPPYHG